MRFRKLDLNLLVTLNVLICERSVTRAAERLHISQPAVSAALSKLRHHFNDELIISIGRKMVLTSLAESLREPLAHFLHAANGIVDAVPHFDPLLSSRRFSIVASDVVMVVLLAPLVRSLARAAPGVSLEMFEPRGNRLLEDLEQGEVDLLILPSEYKSDRFPHEPLYEDSYSCVIWSGNTLVGDKLTLDVYEQLGHVSMNFGRAQNPALVGATHERAGLHLRSSAVVPYFDLTAEFIVGTDHVTVLPTRLAQWKARTQPLRVMEPPIAFPGIMEVMQWQEHQGGDPGISWLQTMLRGEAGKSAAE